MATAEQVRLIVDSLNDEPFNLGLTLISFDNLPNERLLQILSDVIAWINATDAVDIRAEDAGQTALRILHFLKILKFKPPTDIEQLEEWRAGIVEGAPSAVYPVLAYLFANVDMLKQRAYLARFLVRVDVPPEFQDADIAAMQAEVGQLMEQFKEVHSRAMEITGESEHLDGIKADIKQMEQEKEQVSRKIERIDAKVKNVPNIDRILEFTQTRRTQQERYAQAESQKAEIRPWMIKAEKKLKRLEGTLEELQHAADNIDPSEMIEQLEAEIQTNSYLADEKLLREIEAKRPAIAELSRVVQGPAIDEASIQRLMDDLDAKQATIRALVEARERSEEKHDENFSIYRHQTATVERKKAAVAERLQDARQELESIEAGIARKKREMRERSGGQDVVTSVQFRNYVNKIRVKTNDYKKKRRELDALTGENNILARTGNILAAEWNELREKIESMGGRVDDATEVNVQVPSLSAARPKTAAPRTDDTDELRRMVKDLNARLAERSDELAPLRSRHQQRTDEFNSLLDTVKERKRDYERRKAALESGLAALKSEVFELDRRRAKTEEKLTTASEKLRAAREQAAHLERERKGEVRPLVEVLQEQLDSAQAEYDALDAQRATEGNVDEARAAKAQWRGLVALFEAKLRAAAHSEQSGHSALPIGDRIP